MATSPGEGIRQGGDIDLSLQLPAPTYELIHPQSAPQELLNLVKVNTERQCLEASTIFGNVSVELYWRMDENPESPEARGDFFPTLSPDFDPDAADNPVSTQNYPYVTLPNGALYETVVRAPLEAIDHEWSEEDDINIGGNFGKLTGMSLATFRERFPGVEVDLPEGRYSITASGRSRPTLAIAARVEDGEPLTRIQKVTSSSVDYKEQLLGGFQQSQREPETAVALINSRATIRDGGQAADIQRLEFREHDGFQRSGPDAEKKNGQVELILFGAMEIEFTGFTFTKHEIPAPLSRDLGSFGMYGSGLFGDGFRGQSTKGGLIAGETRYRPPETVPVNMSGIKDPSPIAAFRFALAGTRT